MDGEEAEVVSVAGDVGARDDQRLRVGLVLDLAYLGGGVGVEEPEGLQVVEVEAAADDGEAEVALGGLALLEDGRGCRGCDERRGRGGEGGDEHHFRIEPVKKYGRPKGLG